MCLHKRLFELTYLLLCAKQGCGQAIVFDLVPQLLKLRATKSKLEMWW
jgi:hypothetical protein